MTYSPPGSVIVGPVSQTTTAALVPVAGSIIDLAQTLDGNAVYTIQETGGVNGITFKVQASLDQVTWFDMNVDPYDADGSQVSGNILFPLAASGAYVLCQPAFGFPWPGRYLQVCVEDTSSGDHGVVLVNGFGH